MMGSRYAFFTLHRAAHTTREAIFMHGVLYQAAAAETAWPSGGTS